MEVKFLRFKSRMDISRWQISKSTKVVRCNFAPALTISKILTLKTIPPKSRARSCSTISAMITFDGKYNNLKRIFASALIVSEIYNLQFFTFISKSRSHSTIFAMTSFECKYIKSTNVSHYFIFVIYHTISEIYIYINIDILYIYIYILPSGSRRSRSHSTIFAMTMTNIKIYKCFHTFLLYLYHLRDNKRNV